MSRGSAAGRGWNGGEGLRDAVSAVVGAVSIRGMFQPVWVTAVLAGGIERIAGSSHYSCRLSASWVVEDGSLGSPGPKPVWGRGKGGALSGPDHAAGDTASRGEGLDIDEATSSGEEHRGGQEWPRKGRASQQGGGSVQPPHAGLDRAIAPPAQWTR
jgi:hypothetical protein